MLRSRTTFAVLAWAAVFFASWWPFEFVSTPGRVLGWPVFGEPNGEMVPRELLLHLVAFWIVGVLDRIQARRYVRHGAVSRVLLRGVILCGVIEAVQLYIPGRHAELMDLIANVWALAIGHLLVSPL